jgi:hypothetical protein
MNGRLVKNSRHRPSTRVIAQTSIASTYNDNTLKKNNKFNFKGKLTDGKSSLNITGKSSYMSSWSNKSQWSQDVNSMGEMCVEFMPPPSIEKNKTNKRIDWSKTHLNDRALDLEDDDLPSDFAKLMAMTSSVSLSIYIHYMNYIKIYMFMI